MREFVFRFLISHLHGASSEHGNLEQKSAEPEQFDEQSHGRGIKSPLVSVEEQTKASILPLENVGFSKNFWG